MNYPPPNPTPPPSPPLPPSSPMGDPMQPSTALSPVPTKMTGVARVVTVLLLLCAGLAAWGSYYAHTFLQDFLMAGEQEELWTGVDPRTETHEVDSDARRPAHFLTAVPLPIALFALISALGTWRRWFWIRIFTPIWTWLYMIPFGIGMLLALIMIDDYYGTDIPTGLMVNLGLFALIPVLLILVFILMFTPGFRLWVIRKKKRVELEHHAIMHSYGGGPHGRPPATPPGTPPYEQLPPVAPPGQYGSGYPPPHSQPPGMQGPYSPPSGTQQPSPQTPGQQPPGPFPPQ